MAAETLFKEIPCAGCHGMISVPTSEHTQQFQTHDNDHCRRLAAEKQQELERQWKHDRAVTEKFFAAKA